MTAKPHHKRRSKPPATPISPAFVRQLQAQPGFPTPPIVATRLIALTRQPDPDIMQIVEVVSLDAALTARVLRLANSPRYLARKKCANLRRALVMMGVNAALTVGLSFSLLNSLRDTKAKGLDHTLFWRRNLLSAISAQCLGEAIKSPMVEELFMTALIQDIGMLALANIDPNFYGDPIGPRTEHFALADLERQRFGYDHADVGAALLGTWDLPDRAIEAVRLSHLPSREPARSEATRGYAVVAISGVLADLLLKSRTVEACGMVTRMARQSLGLDERAVGWVLERIRDVMPDTEAMFGLDLGVNPQAIVAEARGLIAVLKSRVDGDVPRASR